MAGRRSRTSLVVFAVVVGIFLGGVVGGGPPGLGDGTATVELVSPSTDRLETTAGRFGTAATYVRIPDLVADVTTLSGNPRLVYRVRVPALDIDRQRTRVLSAQGRARVHMPDRAYPPRDSGDEAALPDPGTYQGRLVVRVQSVSHDRTVVNRTLQVEVTQ